MITNKRGRLYIILIILQISSLYLLQTALGDDSKNKLANTLTVSGVDIWNGWPTDDEIVTKLGEGLKFQTKFGYRRVYRIENGLILEFRYEGDVDRKWHPVSAIRLYKGEKGGVSKAAVQSVDFDAITEKSLKRFGEPIRIELNSGRRTYVYSSQGDPVVSFSFRNGVLMLVKLSYED